MKLTRAAATAVIAAVALTVTSCTKPDGDPSVLSAPARPPAALTIVTPQPQADLTGVAALVTGSAQTSEHLEIVSGSGTVLSSAVAPAPPVMAGPALPPGLPANPTQFQADAHQRQEQAFAARLTADHRALARSLASRLYTWAATTVGTMTHAADGTGSRSDLQPGISAATTFFTSLQQAGLNLGTRRVLVIFGVAGPPEQHAAAPARQPVRDHYHPRQLPGQPARARRMAGRPAAGRRGPRHRPGPGRSR